MISHIVYWTTQRLLRIVYMYSKQLNIFFYVRKTLSSVVVAVKYMWTNAILHFCFVVLLLSNGKGHCRKQQAKQNKTKQ